MAPTTARMVVDDLVARHYRRLAARYDELLRWSPDFVDAHADRMVAALELDLDDQLVDLGCGPGIYTAAILDRRPLRRPVVAVDPFDEMLAAIPAELPVTRVQADALEFSARPATYDKVLIKEAVHHVGDRRRLFANLRGRLASGGALLLVHVDPHLLDYPLFDAALERARSAFADPDELVRLLTACGFEVERDLLVYEHRVPTERYHEMVASCYLSILTSFTPAELAAGLDEMRARHGDRPELAFTESFDYLLARPSG